MTQTASPADITAVSNILKKVYVSDEIHSQINDDTMLLSDIERTTEYHDAVGDKAVGFVKTGRNVGSSARSLNGGTLGAAGHQKTNKWELDYAANYITVKILGATIAKMKTARQAATRAVTLEVEGAILDKKKDIQRQLYSDGTALIARFAANSSTDTLLLYAATTADAIASNDAIVNGWLQVDQYLDIGTTADSDAIAADAKILDVTESDSAPSIQIDSSVTTTTSHYASTAGNRLNTTSYEMNGLASVVSTGAFAGLTDDTWNAADVNSVGTTLSRAHMQRAYRKIRKYSGKPNRILTSFEHQEDYYNLLQTQVRFSGDSNLAAGKVDGPTFNNIPVVGDADCPRGVMYFLDTRELFLATAGDLQWQNVNTGGDVLAWSQTEDAFVARAAMYANLGTNRRRSFSKITGLTVNS